MSRLCRCAVTALVAGLLFAATAQAHPERPSHFPTHGGEVPQYRTSGPARVVCTAATAKRIQDFNGEVRERNEALLGQCRYRHIQQAVNAAGNGDRILIMPGTYREEPSRRVPTPDPRCRDDYTASEGDPGRPLADLGTGVDQAEQGTEKAPTYKHHRKCPNSLNLIGIIGDRTNDSDRICDDKCHLQIEGTGRVPTDVRVIGSRNKDNVFRADRADGVMFRNFQVQYSDFNNIYVHETDGFHHDRILTRWSREYGLLSFTSDHGLYENIEGYGTGDSAVYPGSGPPRRACPGRDDEPPFTSEDYGIEVRNVNSHHNTIGYSGTAGDSIYVHDSRFHHNSAGLTTDSFASGHPGMPQDCARFENNRVYSNNVNYFNDKRDEYCRKTPPKERNRRIVCPSFQVPVGTGLLIAGGNDNVVKDNSFFDNWRNGVRLLHVPSAARGEPEEGIDTSFRNSFVDNRMSLRPDGTRDPNGQNPRKGDGFADFWWDEQGSGNCWRGNVGPGGSRPVDNGFPQHCPVITPPTPVGSPKKMASQAPCATWDPKSNPDPPGCDWFNTPPEPR
jgi:hypothetical protein